MTLQEYIKGGFSTHPTLYVRMKRYKHIWVAKKDNKFNWDVINFFDGDELRINKREYNDYGEPVLVLEYK